MEDMMKTILFYKKAGYADLMKLIGKTKTYEVKYKQSTYQVEAVVIWDDKTERSIRVSVFTDYIKKKWWHIGDRSAYSAIVRSDGTKDEWTNPQLTGL